MGAGALRCSDRLTTAVIGEALERHNVLHFVDLSIVCLKGPNGPFNYNACLFIDVSARDELAEFLSHGLSWTERLVRKFFVVYIFIDAHILAPHP